jgi:hypothetical protein
MSFFRPSFPNAHLLVIMLTFVAGDYTYVQETFGKEGRFHVKNATLQQHYGRTAEVSSSSYSALCYFLCLCYTKCHAEPLEICRVTAAYMYHIRWRVLWRQISGNKLRQLF